jgi:hypothetical protein
MSSLQLRRVGGALALVLLGGCAEHRATEKPGPSRWVGSAEAGPALPVPFVVDDHFHPSNCFDDTNLCKTVLFEPKGCGTPELERPEAAQGQCYGFVYTPTDAAGFGGVYFVHHPLGQANWGTEEGQPIEPGAK